MTAADLADVTGIVAALATVRAKVGDTRPKERIADEILREHDAPDLGPLLGRLSLALRRATAVALVAAVCAPPPPSDEACHFGPPFTYCDAAANGAGG